MRSTFASLCLFSILLVASVAVAAADIEPDALLQRGLESYRAAKYQDAATDLSAAAQAMLSPDQMQKYVDTGNFESLGQLETALIYLALSEARLGHDDPAHDAIVRLLTAERIEPLYAQLPLQADALEFERLVKRLMPGATLPGNVYLARGGAPAGTVTQVAQAAAPAATAPPTETAPPRAAIDKPEPTAAATPPAAQTGVVVAPPPPATPVAVHPPEPAQVAQTVAVPPPSAASDRERYIERRLAEEREKIEKAADERIAADRVAAQRELEERVAVERAAAQKAAEQQIAAAEKNAREQIAAAQKNAQEQIAAIRREAQEQIAAATKGRRDYLSTVREADSFAINGKLDSARRLYAIVANAPDASRDLLAEAAVGLYRAGGFRDAVNAFRRVAPFARGEEDLRYYDAVSLYESGNYTDAKRELACALPYIEHSDDVARYQAKIDMTGTE